LAALRLAIELLRLQRGAANSTPPFRGGLSGWQRRIACQYIEDNLAKDISLADLASLAHLSPAYFNRAFRQSFGVPPYRYQRELRVARAKTLLADSKLQ
jgi:AraC family transcriptional regulator